MKRTIVVLAFFAAAILAGLYMKFSTPTPVVKDVKEKFAQRQVGMPLDMQSVDGPTPTGYNGVSPLLGSEPKPL